MPETASSSGTSKKKDTPSQVSKDSKVSMTIDVYSSNGTKKGTADLPTSVFAAPINEGLMHQMLVLQQSNRRSPIAHTKTRGEIQGSTRKLFRQKGTGRARRGQVRTPVMRGGNKAFGPRSNANYTKDMPKNMRRAALRGCLSLQAKHGTILGLEEYGESIKTKDLQTLLGKLPVDIGRKILFVIPENNEALTLSARNIPGAKTVLASYLNPEDVLGAHKIVFLVDALKKTEEVFGSKPKKATTAKKVETKADQKDEKSDQKEEEKPEKKLKEKDDTPATS